jgi:phosphatidylglycerophosphate synthase
MGPSENFCLKRRISPNQITLTATALCFVVFALFARGHILTGGWMVLLIGSLDILDGRVARASARVTLTGGFLDSVMDRYQDFLLFSGLVVHYRESWVLYPVLLAMAGATFVPYVRAKGDGMGIDLSRVGTMQRPERFFMLGFGSIVSSILQISLMPMPMYGIGNPPPQHLLILVILFLAVSTNWTAVRRITYAMDRLAEKEGRK